MMDKSVVCRSFSEAAAQYDSLALFQRRINERMLCLLPEHMPAGFRPVSILDAGCGTGLGLQCLKTFWSDVRMIGCDLSPEMVAATQHKQLDAVVGDIEDLPFDTTSFNLVWSCLSLQWCSPERAFKELFRVLKSDGMLFFSTLAPGTLCEVNHAFSGFDSADHTLSFYSQTDLENVLVETGFREIRLQQETHQVFYPDVHSAMTSIRGIGAGNVHQRRTSLFGKQAWKTVQERYESFRQEAGLPVTYEVVIGSAFR